MRNFFHIFSLLTLSLLLSACFGGGGSIDSSSTSADESGLVKHVGAGFSIRIPANWEIIPPTAITTPVTGEIELAVRSLINKRGFMNNLIVLSDTVYSEVSSAEYMRQNMLWASKNYLSMTVDRDEQVEFSDTSTSRLVTYHAKYNEITEERLFMQTTRICGKKVYLITLGLENDFAPEDYDRYHPIFASFSCP